MKPDFLNEVEKTLAELRKGKIILYPTDTVWGIGCDAKNETAIQKIFELKKRDDKKSLIILVADERDILKYVAAPDLQVFDFLAQQQRPTTIIFQHALGLPHNLISEEGTIAIRIVQDEFCKHLIKRLRVPLVSTSANISGQPTPATFADISPAIKKGVDYIVNWRQDDTTPTQPSQIIRWKANGEYEVIRR